MNVYEKLNDLGIELGKAPAPLGLYHYSVVTSGGELVFTSGAGCRKGEKAVATGKLGAEVSIEEGQECARQCVINVLAGLEQVIGDLNRVKRIVKVLGFVASAPDFYQQPKVINGASELLKEIFGENGVGARSAVGMAALPGNIPVEIEMVVEIEKKED